MSIDNKFSRFLIVGGFATILQFLILEIGTSVFTYSASMSSGIGYLLGSILSYFLNYFFTFQSDSSHLHTTIKFYTMVFIGWLISSIMMAIMVDFSNLNKWWSQIITTILIVFWNFFISKKWVFYKNEKEKNVIREY